MSLTQHTLTHDFHREQTGSLRQHSLANLIDDKAHESCLWPNSMQRVFMAYAHDGSVHLCRIKRQSDTAMQCVEHSDSKRSGPVARHTGISVALCCC